jgi:GT2 family glycosyltransferase
MAKLAIILPTLNRGALFHDTVRQVLQQDYRDYEFWLIDQSDPPQRALNEALVAELADPRIHYVFIPQKGLPNARNEGLARIAADTEIVLFLDDDVILLSSRFLEAHLACFEDAQVGGVTGRIVERTVRPNINHTANHLSPGGRTITNLWGTERCEIPTLKGANMSYRLSAIRQVGGFDRRYDGSALLEDADFSTRIHKAGWKLIFEPKAELIHLSAPSGGVRLEDQLRYEHYRFKSSAYFQLKHRGWRRFPLYLGSFGAIALKRAAHWRDPSILPALLKAMQEGVESFKAGPDEEIPQGISGMALRDS